MVLFTYQHMYQKYARESDGNFLGNYSITMKTCLYTTYIGLMFCHDNDKSIVIMTGGKKSRRFTVVFAFRNSKSKKIN